MNRPLTANTPDMFNENEPTLGSEQPKILKFIANFLSYVFHPVFIPLLVFAYMLYIHPYLFIGLPPKFKLLVFIRAIVLFTFFPLITVLLLKAAGFVQSIKLNTQKDRIIPLIACGIWYFWAWNVWHQLPEYPHEAVVFTMGVFFSSSIAILLNVYMKISLHAISVGVMVAFFVWLGFYQGENNSLYMAAAFLIAGIVCTARFIVSNHTQREVYFGFFAGVLALLAATYFA